MHRDAPIRRLVPLKTRCHTWAFGSVVPPLRQVERRASHCRASRKPCVYGKGTPSVEMEPDLHWPGVVAPVTIRHFSDYSARWGGLVRDDWMTDHAAMLPCCHAAMLTPRVASPQGSLPRMPCMPCALPCAGTHPHTRARATCFAFKNRMYAHSHLNGCQRACSVAG